MSNKIYGFLQLLFRLVLIYFLTFIWARYYSQNIHFAIWITALITFFIEIVIRLITNKKNKNIELKQSEISKTDVLVNTFIFKQTNFTLTYFYDVLKTKHMVSKKKNYIVIEQNSQKIVLYPFFTLRPFFADDYIDILNKIKTEKADKLLVCVSKADKDAFQICKSSPIQSKILEKYDVYQKLIKPYDYYPPQNELIEIKKEKTNLKKLFANAFDKKRTKGYFIGSIILLLSCFIVPYNLYYLIFSSIMLTLAIISFVKPLFAKHKNEPVF